MWNSIIYRSFIKRKNEYINYRDYKDYIIHYNNIRNRNNIKKISNWLFNKLKKFYNLLSSNKIYIYIK